MNLKRSITAGLAAAALAAGGAALAAPAGASVITNFCPSNGGYNGEQQDASHPALTVSYQTGAPRATVGTTLLGSCMYFAHASLHYAGDNAKVWEEAPAGHQNGSALTVTGLNQLTFTALQNLNTQQWIYNNDGSWSPASNRHVVLKTNGNNGLLSLAPYNPSNVLPSEDFTDIG